MLGQLSQTVVHLHHRPAQGVGGPLRFSHDGGQQVRHALVKVQFQALGVNQDQLHFLRRGLHQDGNYDGIDGHALAGAGGAGNQQVGHLRQFANANFAGDVFSEAQTQPRGRTHELARLHQFAQVNDLAPQVGHFNAHRGFARDAIDHDRLRLHGQAQVVNQIRNAAVLDAGFRLEFECGDHRAGVNLRYVSGDAEFEKFGGQPGGAFL